MTENKQNDLITGGEIGYKMFIVILSFASGSHSPQNADTLT